MAKVISVINQKGGVGKTTITFNLSLGLSKKYKVLVIDNDPQGNLTYALAKDPVKLESDIIDIYQNDKELIIPAQFNENLDYIGANIHSAIISDKRYDEVYLLKESIDKIKDKYDFVFIDCNPSLGFLSISALIASEQTLIPVNAEPFSLIGLRDLMTTINRIKGRMNISLSVLGIIINSASGRKTILNDNIETDLRTHYPNLVFETVIPQSVSISESVTQMKSVMDYAPNTSPADKFNMLISEFERRING